VADPGLSQASPARTARRIAFFTYVPVAALWIFGTDLVLAALNGSIDRLLLANMFKGGLFTLVTGTVLYLVIRRELTRREALHEDHRTLTENVPDLVFRLRIRPDFAFEYVSPSCVDVAGFVPEEYYGNPMEVLASIHPEDRARFEGLLSDIDAPVERAELRWVHKNGRVVCTDIRVRKERDDSGAVVRVSGVVRDITERAETERRRALLATALEAAGEAVMVTDRNGTIQYVNRAFTEMTGYLPEDAIGRTPNILKSGDQGEAFYRNLWGTVLSGRRFRGVLVNRRSDGLPYEQATSITPVRSPDGQIEQFIAVGRDITIQRALERRMRFTEKMDAVGQLAAGVAHDFRNLLNVILVNAELIRTPRGETLPEVDEIVAAAGRGADLVGRLLKVAREQEVKPRRTDLAQLVRDMRGMFRPMLVETIDLTLDVGEPAFAEVDPDLLRDALLNLVTNAGHAMSAGGRLVVSVTPERASGSDRVDAVRIEVVDTGTGMDDDTLAKIFDPFFTTKANGTGLGLPMVQGIVERHGGTLDVASAPGVGTTVTLRLPAGLEEEDPEPAAPEPASMQSEHVAEGRILLVEDDDRLRAAAERVLVRIGYEVTVAENGRRALEHLLGTPDGWDLVLSDLVMPEMGGLELYERAQERGWGVPFLFMSGHGPSAVTADGEGPVGVAFLEKPWTVDTLRERVTEALRAQRPPH